MGRDGTFLTQSYCIHMQHKHTHLDKEDLFVCLLKRSVLNLQVALKRQQAVEDAIAMRLVSNETGKTIDALPPGKIFGMSITEPCNTPTINSNATENLSLVQKTKNRKCFGFWFYFLFLLFVEILIRIGARFQIEINLCMSFVVLSPQHKIYRYSEFVYFLC